MGQMGAGDMTLPTGTLEPDAICPNSRNPLPSSRNSTIKATGFGEIPGCSIVLSLLSCAPQCAHRAAILPVLPYALT